MLTTAAEYLKRGQHREALASLKVRCQCLYWRGLNEHVSCQMAGAEGGLTILVTDEAGEVGTVCDIDEWCPECKRDDIWTPHSEHPDCEVTARLYLWDGSPVDCPWSEIVLPLRPTPGKDSALTAVVLVGELPDVEPWNRDTAGRKAEWDKWAVVADARAACASAGVQFIDKEGVLEL